MFSSPTKWGVGHSGLISGSSSPGSSPAWGHCVVFLGKTIHSHSVSLHPGVQMCTTEFNAGGNPPIQGVEILLVASCYRNRDKLWLIGPLGSYAVFSTYPTRWDTNIQCCLLPKYTHPQYTLPHLQSTIISYYMAR